MEIQIPSYALSLKPKLETLLLLAQQQGFTIAQLTVLTSKESIFLINNPQQITIATDLYNDAMVDISEQPLNFILNYQQVNYGYWADCVIHLAINEQEQRVDSWQHNNASEDDIDDQLLNVTELSLLDQEWHFVWFLLLISLGFPVQDALVICRAALMVSRETWPTDFTDLPQFASTAKKFNSFESVPAFPKLHYPLGFYPVVDDVKWLEKLLPLGIKTIQLRIKQATSPQLEQQIQQAVCLAEQYKAQLFINDHWQLAIKYGAFGVHLGQEDLLSADLVALAQAKIRLGVSTHGFYELIKLQTLQVSYLAFGHIFPTTTKIMPSKPQGLARLACYQSYAKQLGIESVAIGGIDLTNAHDVLATGVNSIAVVRAITQAPDTAYVVRQFQQMLILNSAKEIKKEVDL